MNIKEALRIVIDYLDKKMEEEPSREIADLSNGLEGVLARVED